MSKPSTPSPEDSNKQQPHKPDKPERRKNWFFRGMGALLGGILATVLLTDAPMPWGKTSDDTPAETRPHKQPQESDNESSESWPRYAPETYTPQRPQQEPATGSISPQSPANIPGRVIWESTDGTPGDNSYLQDKTDSWRVVNGLTDIHLTKAEMLAKDFPRSEIMMEASQANELKMGQEYTFQYSFQLAPDHQNGPEEEFIVGQLHGDHLEVSPPLALLIKGDQMYLDYRSEAGGKQQLLPIGPVKKGQWYNIQWDVKLSEGADGFARILVDGEEKTRMDGPTSFKDDSPPYFKMGVYWWQYHRAPTEQKHVLIDNMRLIELLTQR